MDSRNLFETPTTYRIIRLEYFAALVTVAVLVVLHWHEIRWIPFVLLFAYIDVIGYIPGAIAARRSRTGYIHRGYYVLYNVMHTLLTAAAVAGLWCLIEGPEWALLALPLHLFTDRSVVGNFLKPFGVRFEPQEHPAYYAAKPLLDRPRPPRWAVESGHAATGAHPRAAGEPARTEAGRI
ncbi:MULTISPECIES: hypothetical protein [Streptomyces]|uniref:hypothetical protein n=1 Tax=Streptomyces TaxID=1883 RepID=UPI0007C48032|nr:MULTISPECIES: hypothetical protein [Streptomyces]NNG87324.1 hypothetical protein [Streptomyces cacaoi]QHF97386.1 hypothetical protein DEH18_30100 [Streptomyces sp. NHF165]